MVYTVVFTDCTNWDMREGNRQDICYLNTVVFTIVKKGSVFEDCSIYYSVFCVYNNVV